METLKKYSKHHTVRYGLPFVIFVVGGSFYLREFSQLRYTFSKKKSITREELEKETGIKMNKEATLEEVYEEVKKIDIDNWEPKRIPRPWEETGISQH